MARLLDRVYRLFIVFDNYWRLTAILLLVGVTENLVVLVILCFKLRARFFFSLLHHFFLFEFVVNLGIGFIIAVRLFT